MSNTPCHHKISINLEFLKHIFSTHENGVLHYSTITTRIDILNNMSKQDFVDLAKWITLRYPEKVEKSIETLIEKPVDPVKQLLNNIAKDPKDPKDSKEKK